MTEPQSWISLGPLTETENDFSAYANDIGIYRANLKGQIVYIGKATEINNGGFRKRLRDYTRSSDSARDFKAGRLMHLHQSSIQIEILVFKRSVDIIHDIAMQEAKLIRELIPIWNNKI